MNRSELIFLYDIKDNNPNGDPIDQNKPRMELYKLQKHFIGETEYDPYISRW